MIGVNRSSLGRPSRSALSNWQRMANATPMSFVSEPSNRWASARAPVCNLRTGAVTDGTSRRFTSAERPGHWPLFRTIQVCLKELSAALWKAGTQHQCWPSRPHAWNGLRDLHVPEDRRSEVEDTLDVLSEGRRLDPLSP